VPAAGAAESRSHRVERGDTWPEIARRYGISQRQLGAANPDVDPERVRVGETLDIPAAGGGDRVHLVGPGDTLWGIARRYNVPAELIREVNGLTDERLRLNQSLVIPFDNP